MNLSELVPLIEPLDLRSCLVSHRGALVVEHYRNEQTAVEIAKINSCTKSVLSALICIALGQKLLPDPSSPASLFFPQLADDADPRKRDMTIEHLLTMSAGFQWQEFKGLNSFPRMTRTPDWVAFTLEQQMADRPGKRMEYNSGVSQMLAFILVQASGMSAAQFAERYLFGPLGITEYEWEHDPQGIHTGGFGLRLKPADMLKFGQLYERLGRWEENQIIPEDWLIRSITPVLAAESPRRGMYGWHWWMDSFELLASDHKQEQSLSSVDYYYALGFGGQLIIVVPVMELVVVLTNDRWRKGKPAIDVFQEYIVPLLKQSQSE